MHILLRMYWPPRKYFVNCYLPACPHRAFLAKYISGPMEVLNELDLRIDGRLPSEIRFVDICYMSGPSIVYTQGLTKIRVSVAGPKPKNTKLSFNMALSINKSARIEVNEWNRLAEDLRHKIYDLFRSILIPRPTSSVDIDILVLEDNGSLFSAIVNSVSICCAYVGIQMLDLVLSCSVGIYTEVNLFDLCAAEEDCKLPNFVICYGINRKTLFGTSLVGGINVSRMPNLLNSAINCLELVKDRIVPSLKNLK